MIIAVFTFLQLRNSEYIYVRFRRLYSLAVSCLCSRTSFGRHGCIRALQTKTPFSSYCISPGFRTKQKHADRFLSACFFNSEFRVQNAECRVEPPKRIRWMMKRGGEMSKQGELRSEPASKATFVCEGYSLRLYGAR